MSVISAKVAMIAIIASLFLALSIPTSIDAENDAPEVIVEGDLTDTARYRLMSDYVLYFEGTGPVSCDCTLWYDYVHLIKEINISDGITDLDTYDMMLYTGLDRVTAGRDLKDLSVFTYVNKVIFPNGCGNMEVLNAWFYGDCLIFLYKEDLVQFADSYCEIFFRQVPNSDVPDSVKDFVRYDRVYELYVTGIEDFSSESRARVIYGDSTIPMTVYHLIPTYMVESEVDYYCTFEILENGYYVLHIEVSPLIPDAPLIGAVMIAVFTIAALIYYFKVVRVKENGR